jgi:hypothetical protein
LHPHGDVDLLHTGGNHRAGCTLPAARCVDPLLAAPGAYRQQQGDKAHRQSDDEEYDQAYVQKADSFNDYSRYIAAGKRRQRLCLPASVQ